MKMRVVVAVLAVLAVATLVCATGCIDLSVPKGGKIRCSSSTDCPSGLTCRATIEQCVPADARQTPPKITVAITPSDQLSHVAGHDKATLSVTLDEAADVSAVATRASSSVELPCAAKAAQTGADVECAIDVAALAALGEGAVAVDVIATDAFGNRATATTGFTLDFTAPALVGTPTIAPSIARAGDPILVRVALTEPVVDGATLTTGASANGPAFTLEQNSAGVLSFSHTAAANEDGAYELSLGGVVDAAGNAADAIDVGALTIDATAPSFVAMTTDSARYSANAGFDTITASFTLDATPAQFHAEVGGHAMTCPFTNDAPASSTFACTFTVAASDWPAGESTQRVSATAVDEAGNASDDFVDVVLDFAPPDVVAGSTTLGITAPPGSLVTAVDQLGVGAVVDVSFVVTEPLGADPNASTAPSAMSFDAAHLAGLLYAIEGSFTDGNASDGAPLTLSIELVDLVGNTATVTLALPAPGLVPDVTAPTAPAVDTSRAVVYERAPHGENASGGVPSFSVTGANAAVEAGATVVAFDVNGNEAGRAKADANGAFSIALSRADRDDVFVVAVDGAGNTSSLAHVRDLTVVSSLGGRVVGSDVKNGNALFGAPDLVLTQGLGAPGVTEIDASNAVVGDGAVATTFAAPRWEQRAFAAAPTQPSTRKGHAMAYDEKRGVVVLFGGTDLASGNIVGDTWEWNGFSWKQRILAGPDARTGHAMAYDEKRGVVVLFGGTGPIVSSGNTQVTPEFQAAFEDTWTFDGVAWTKQAPAHFPERRTGHAMTWDPVHQRVVLFGGTSPRVSNFIPQQPEHDTATWDGADWFLDEQRPPANNLSGQAMAFDPTRGTVLRFDHTTTSSWDGFAWTTLPIPGPVFAGSAVSIDDPVLVFDVVRNQIALVGGKVNTGPPFTYNLVGNAWQTNAPFTSQSGMDGAYDRARNQTVTFGGDGGSTTSVRDPDGAPFFNAAPAIVSNQHGPLAFDPTVGEVRVTSSVNSQQWNGRRWSFPVSSPSTNALAVTFFDADNALFAYDGTTGNTFELRNAWTQIGAGGPTSSHPLVTFDRATGQLLQVRRNGALETWLWNPASASWSQLAPAAAPALFPADDPKLVFDDLHGQLELVGTSGAFAWDGATWSTVQQIGGTSIATVSASFDSSRGRVIAFAAEKALSGQSPIIFQRTTIEASTTAARQLFQSFGPASEGGGMAFDTARGVVVLDSSDGTWEWTYGSAHPAQIFRARVGALPAGAVVDHATVRWSATAAGRPGGVAQTGFDLFAFDQGTWSPIATSLNNGESDVVVDHASALLTGDAADLLFAARATAENGVPASDADSDQAGFVATDFAEVAVDVRLPGSVIPVDHAEIDATIDATSTTSIDRVDASCASAGVGALGFRVVHVTNPARDDVVVDVDTLASGSCASADTVLAVFASFDPNNPSATCTQANDDVAGAGSCSALSFDLAANTSADVVVWPAQPNVDTAFTLHVNSRSPIEIR